MPLPQPRNVFVFSDVVRTAAVSLALFAGSQALVFGADPRSALPPGEEKGYYDKRVSIVGLEAAAPLKISLNGAVILEGKNTFLPDRWTVHVIPPKAGLLRVGTNTLEIENTGNGPVSAVPWFGISFVRLRSSPEAAK